MDNNKVPPAPPAVIKAIMTIQPDITTVEELQDHVDRFEPLVATLDQIGIREEALDERLRHAQAAQTQARQAHGRRDGRAGRETRPAAVQTLIQGAGSWSPCRPASTAITCRTTRAPCSASSARARRGSGSCRRPAAGAPLPGTSSPARCASLYHEWTGHLPKILNYRLLGPHNDYGNLVKVTFDTFELGSSWGKSAEDAARELARIVKNTDKKTQDEP